MESPSLRIYLTGNVWIESNGQLIEERQLPARQGRLAFVYLACHHDRAVTRDELTDAIWGGSPPPALEIAISALASKLRRLFSLIVPGRATIIQQGGCYQLGLPVDAWMDVDAAVSAIHEAEGTLRRGDVRRAWGPAVEVVTITRRPFLPGEDREWVVMERARLQQLLVRGLECLSEISLRNDECTLAAQYATETLAIEPFRETAYRRLMQAQTTLGNPAEALKTYERCRKLLVEELGVDPSPETEQLYLGLLHSS